MWLDLSCIVFECDDGDVWRCVVKLILCGALLCDECLYVIVW